MNVALVTVVVVVCPGIGTGSVVVTVPTVVVKVDVERLVCTLRLTDVEVTVVVTLGR